MCLARGTHIGPGPWFDIRRHAGCEVLTFCLWLSEIPLDPRGRWIEGGLINLIHSRAIGSVLHHQKKKKINLTFVSHREIHDDYFMLFNYAAFKNVWITFPLFSDGGCGVAVACGHLQSSLIRKLWRSLSMLSVFFVLFFFYKPWCGVWRDYSRSAMRRLKKPASSLCQRCRKWALAGKKKPYWRVNVGLLGQPLH